MIRLITSPVVLRAGALCDAKEAAAHGVDLDAARRNTLAHGILAAHNTAPANEANLCLRFDALASHDITYVGIIQTARASGLTEFPMPYALTNCHNSLCAVGGTINEDDHCFGLSAAQKYGGIYVPPHLAVIHQYVREMMTACGGMILGSDSHTRYGALGVMGIGEGGPELVKQLLCKTYDVPAPEVVCIWLENAPRPGVGPQDVALAIIGEVFKNGFVKNKIVEFAGPGIAGLSVEYRCGIDVMTTETTCLSSIWTTDHKVRDYLAAHGRANDYKELRVVEPACYDGCIMVDLAAIEPMVALPFHPGNVFKLADVIRSPRDILAGVEEDARMQFGKVGEQLKLVDKIRDGKIWVDQAIIAGCAGGSFENIMLTAGIMDGKSTGSDVFSLSVYPASEPQALALVRAGATAKLMASGAVLKNAFCGPCFGAGDTPANGALSIRHATRNFPNREGSKPMGGQLAAVALMDARSIAATAANQGRLTSATDLDWNSKALNPDLTYNFESLIYERRVYKGFKAAKPETPLVFGPNIADWPAMQPLPQHLVLELVSVITDPVTTTDELIPSGETSSFRSNPLKLAEFTLGRKDPGYVGRAKAVHAIECARLNDPTDVGATALLRELGAACNFDVAACCGKDLSQVGFGSAVFAVKPGDGSAREQAASCQKVLGGWANLAVEYATKRYRSNLINWGMLPFTVDAALTERLAVGDRLVLCNVRDAVAQKRDQMEAKLVRVRPSGEGEKSVAQSESVLLTLKGLTDDERQIILDGCLINFYNRV